MAVTIKRAPPLDPAAVAALAQQLYEVNIAVPAWESLSNTTRSVWLDKATLKLRGNPSWWSVTARAA